MAIIRMTCLLYTSDVYKRQMLNSKVMDAYHQALDEQQSENESENMSEDESESFTQSM